ncbi:unnamed protein product [Lathyrus sativus]|nr:unnamed protein product [Lathyrus sativus]
MELVDLPVVGNRFTWFSSSAKCKSILDRFLFSKGLIKEWNLDVQYVGDRYVSDHMPIWVKIYNSNWGPKPFKVFRCWFDHLNFMDFVRRERNSFQASRKACLNKNQDRSG